MGTVDSAARGLVRPLHMERCGLVGWGWQTTEVCNWDSNGQTNMYVEIGGTSKSPRLMRNEFGRSLSSSSFPSCSIDYRAHNAGIRIIPSYFLLDYPDLQATVSHETRYTKPPLTITPFCLGIFLFPRRLRSARPESTRCLTELFEVGRDGQA